MLNIFTAKKGKHDARRFGAKYRRALVAAAIVTCALLTSVSAAMIISRDTLSEPGAVAPIEGGSAAAAVNASGRVTAPWMDMALPNALQSAGSATDRASDATDRASDAADSAADATDSAADATDSATKATDSAADATDSAANVAERAMEIAGRATQIGTRSVSDRLSRALRAITMSRAVREELSEHSTVAYAGQALTVFTPQGQFPGQTRLEDGVALVDAVAFARFVGDCDISRDGDTVYMKSHAYDVSVPLGSEYLTSSGRVFWARRTHTTDGDAVFVPLDTLVRAFGLERAKDDEGYGVRLVTSATLLPGDSFYREDEVYWLSRIIQAESRGECLRGKIAVGNVVLNRVRDKRFPNTIYGVIFDRSCGVQFTPSVNGTIHLEPSAESVIAAKICLEGYSVSDEITFFFNPAISQNTWISDNRVWVCTIGNHAFYS